MIDDACRIGLCNFYDNGSGVFGLIVGIAIGVMVILGFQAIGRRRRSGDEE